MIISRRLRTTLAALGFAGSLSACSITLDAGTLGVKASLSEPVGEEPAGEAFQVTERAVFLFWGILPVARPSLEQALAGQLIEANEVANLTVKVRSRWSDIVISALTVGLIVPRSVTYEGVVVDSGN